MGRLLRRGPLTTAIPRVSAGGLKPEIVARVWETRPDCYRTFVVKVSVSGRPGPAGIAALRNTQIPYKPCPPPVSSHSMVLPNSHPLGCPWRCHGSAACLSCRSEAAIRPVGNLTGCRDSQFQSAFWKQRTYWLCFCKILASPLLAERLQFQK